MTRHQIEWLIVELMAQDDGIAAGDLWRELAERGDGLPVDSLLAAEVLTRVQAAAGVELPTTAETARALRSVSSFAEAVWQLLPNADHDEVASA